MIEVQDRAAALPPTLTALLVYLRPARRRDLLSLLADFGIFVVERQGMAGAMELAASTGADLALVVGNDDQATLAAIASLSQGSRRVSVVSLPKGADGQRFLDAGATVCLTDDDLGPASLTLFASIANRARSARTGVRGSGATIFGGLTFDAAVPALHAGSQARALSRSEQAVLARLLVTPGRPVGLRELERCATPPGTRVHPGFLKAVVLRLRRKVEELGGDPELLGTVRGFGYSLAGATNADAAASGNRSLAE